MRYQLKTLALLGGLGVLVVVLGEAVAPGYLGVFATLAVVMNLGAYFYSDQVVLAMHGARELSPREAPELYSMVADLARRAELPMPRLALIADPIPNAFATGRNPEHAVVAVTRGILEVLSPRELRGVLAHELGHVKNRDVLVSTVAAMMAALVASVASSLRWAMMFGLGGGRSDEDRSGLGTLLLILVAPIAATLLQLGVSRSREYLADEEGARISGDPEALASALVKLERAAHMMRYGGEPATASLFIVNPLTGEGGVRELFSTHPPTQKRVARLLALSRRA
jgi:heat shock protein HtpX